MLSYIGPTFLFIVKNTRTRVGLALYGSVRIAGNWAPTLLILGYQCVSQKWLAMQITVTQSRPIYLLVYRRLLLLHSIILCYKLIGVFRSGYIISSASWNKYKQS